MDWRSISHVPDSALLRGDLVSDTVFFDKRHAYSDVSELKVELREVVAVRVCVSCNKRVCPHNLLDLAVNEVIKGVNVLLDEASDSEERRHEFPFVLHELGNLNILRCL